MRIPQPVSGVDIQAAVIALLQASPFIAQASLPGDTANTPIFSGQILDDDPGAPDVVPGQPLAVDIALHLLAEGDGYGTGGPAGSGSRRYITYFALIIYVGQNGKRDPVAKRRLAVLTRACREALMKNNVRVDPANPVQRWFSNAFKDDGPATVYQKDSGFRRSVTFINFYSRAQTIAAPS